MLVKGKEKYFLLSFVFFFVVSAAGVGVAGPSWSTYHGQLIEDVDVSETGISLGLNAEGALFIHDRESSFIASWKREEMKPESLLMSRQGDRVLAAYQDGYLALFAHDNQEGEQLWAYRIDQIEVNSTALSSDGDRSFAASAPVEQEQKRPSRMWVFNSQGETVWNKNLESVVVNADINQDYWTAVVGVKYGTTDQPRGKNAIYFFDSGGDLVWDNNLSSSPVAVDFLEHNGRECVLLTAEDDRLVLFDPQGPILWQKNISDLKEVEVKGGYIAALTSSHLYLIDDHGTELWEREVSDINSLSVSASGLVAYTQPARALAINSQGKEILEHSLEEEGVVALSREGSYLLLGSDRVSFFSLQ